MTSSNLSLAGQIGMRGLCQNNFDVCKNNARIIGKHIELPPFCKKKYCNNYVKN